MNSLSKILQFAEKGTELLSRKGWFSLLAGSVLLFIGILSFLVIVISLPVVREAFGISKDPNFPLLNLTTVSVAVAMTGIVVSCALKAVLERGSKPQTSDSLRKAFWQAKINALDRVRYSLHKCESELKNAGGKTTARLLRRVENDLTSAFTELRDEQLMLSAIAEDSQFVDSLPWLHQIKELQRSGSRLKSRVREYTKDRDLTETLDLFGDVLDEIDHIIAGMRKLR